MAPAAPELDAPDLLPGATHDLAAFASSLTFDKIPPDVVAYVKELILDNLGVVLFGVQTAWTQKVVQMAVAEDAKPRSTIFGTGIRTSPALAALANATGGHAFEFDEIHRDSIVHPGSMIVPVILALVEAEGKGNGRDFITAAVAAYEVCGRVGMSATSALFFRGFHPQGTTGVFAAGTAAARILGLDTEATQNALGIAGSQGAGLMAAQEGAMVKRFHAGRAAQSGIYAALLARQGFTGIHNVLEASFGGFLSSHSGQLNISALTADLGHQWETLNVAYKPYAMAASIHTSLDGLKAIMVDNKLTADDLESVDVGMGPMTYQHCAWEYQPKGVTAAQMNMFYGLAVIAADGDAGAGQFSEDRLTEPRLMELIKRMHAHVSPELQAMGPKFRHAAIVTVKTKAGQTYESRQLYYRGTKENPPKPGQVEDKFRALAGRVLSSQQLDRIVELVRDLENQPSLDELSGLLLERS
ncbi:mmgE/PrpD [Rhizodiscina lignyota]|uniref:MmgE/PrpD n=1 Tax=Rhizodiscina lignyota TaxID=1504668 RepID=A0A9P4M5G9_9PEZI|nr:mmgE/PrpD [Rhizodiscina lignyota]